MAIPSQYSSPINNVYRSSVSPRVIRDLPQSIHISCGFADAVLSVYGTPTNLQISSGIVGVFIVSFLCICNGR